MSLSTWVFRNAGPYTTVQPLCLSKVSPFVKACYIDVNTPPDPVLDLNFLTQNRTQKLRLGSSPACNCHIAFIPLINFYFWNTRQHHHQQQLLYRHFQIILCVLTKMIKHNKLCNHLICTSWIKSSFSSSSLKHWEELMSVRVCMFEKK